MTATDAFTAARALRLMDLTSLNEEDTDRSTRELARAADTRFGTPAALCVYARFVPVARQALAERGLAGTVAIATVANFPHGDPAPSVAAQEVAAAVAGGADEVDVVFPWRALVDGDETTGLHLVEACRTAVGDRLLKVIIESGELPSQALVRRASEIAIEGGAHFVKTSSGKVPVNATLQAAETILQAIRASGKPVGFKAAGGVRSVADAAEYLAVADRVMGPGWATPATFRFGASGLLNELLEALGQQSPAVSASRY